MTMTLAFARWQRPNEWVAERVWGGPIKRPLLLLIASLSQAVLHSKAEVPNRNDSRQPAASSAAEILQVGMLGGALAGLAAGGLLASLLGGGAFSGMQGLDFTTHWIAGCRCFLPVPTISAQNCRPSAHVSPQQPSPAATVADKLMGKQL